MIRHIFNDKKIDEADIDDQYSEEEMNSIKTLISDISETVEALFNTDEAKDDLLIS